MYKVIAYYNFADIPDPETFCRDHKKKCREFKLCGRIYVAAEGINGTAAGTEENIEAYQKYLRNLPGFEDIQFKIHTSDEIPFDRLIVKTRPEIVTLKAGVPIDAVHRKGKYLSPRAWRQALESQENMVVIDVRNRYETVIGHFKGAVLPDVDNFYDFPQWLAGAKIDKKQKVLMYCTGGIRCEKFSLYMEDQGYEDVHQLHGGILQYAKDEGGKHFKGKCFVFDDRLAVSVDPDEKDVLGRCEITGEPCDTYINCANFDCNKLFLCSEAGAKQMQGCCSEKCQQAKWRRPFNPENIYAPSRRWYTYYEDKAKKEQ